MIRRKNASPSKLIRRELLARAIRDLRLSGAKKYSTKALLRLLARVPMKLEPVTLTREEGSIFREIMLCAMEQGLNIHVEV